ncbi:NAD(P)/FAD-dependent oxidoreductase [Roseovarius phycicola]|uniref:FAD-binding oxidoreductase n=1 Tax=Roseovarius phycicola TaxID=3080976 RepID=A0ABZ2HLS8_9RHOB
MEKDAQTVAIVGAGIVGVSTAIWLLREGHDVLLIDKAGPGEGTSFGNAGLLASAATLPVPMPGLLKKIPRMLLSRNEPLFLRLPHLPKLLPWLLPYLRFSNETAARQRATDVFPIIGDSLADHQALSGGTGAEGFVVPCDYAFGYQSKSGYMADHLSWSVRKQQGFEWDELSGDSFRDYDPIYSNLIGYAAVLKNHGRITDPGAYVKALAAYAEAQGARILRAEVSDVVRDTARVTGVRVSGDTIPCDAVVLAAGTWSKSLAENLGISVPLHPESGFHMELWEPSKMPRSPVMLAAGKFVITPMEGRIRLAGMVGYGGFDAPPPRAAYELFETYLRQAIPGLTWKDSTHWMGHRPAMRDSIPMIGAVPGVAGAYTGFGHDHVGLTGGPKTGRILAQLISGKTPNINLAPYAPERFTPGLRR